MFITKKQYKKDYNLLITDIREAISKAITDHENNLQPPNFEIMEINIKLKALEKYLKINLKHKNAENYYCKEPKEND